MAYGMPAVALHATHAAFDQSRVAAATGGSARFPHRHVSAQQVLRSFNTRAFKREQPDRSDLMLQFIAEALAQGEPVAFVMYWGKGWRSLLAEPEHRCLDFLASLARRIADVYPLGASMSLVFTDSHASLNGHTAESINSYFQDLATAARHRGFDAYRLNALRAVVGPKGEGQSPTEGPSEDVLAALVTSAAKWFRGEGTIEQGALRYYQANMVEKQVIERAFPRSIFVTFNGSTLRCLFPERLPVFYMYSLRHGVSDKPWFLWPDGSSKRASAGARPHALGPSV